MRKLGILALLAFIGLTASPLQAAREKTAKQSELFPLVVPNGWYLGEVAGLEVGPNGHIYLFNRGAHPLLEFDATGKFVKEIGAGLFGIPHGLRFDAAGNMWTSDQGTHQALRFDTSGNLTLILGRRNEPGTNWYARGYSVALLKEPSDVAVDSKGNIYVADAGNFRVVKYDKNGEPITQWGRMGNGPGEFDFPHSIAIDANDHLYVTDRENGRVQIFSSDGEYLSEWGGFGNPYEIEIADDGTFWISDARAGKILHMDAKGTLLSSHGQWGKEIGDFGFPHGIAIRANGELLVGELLNWRVQLLRH